MGISHGDALLIEDVLDPLVQGEVYVPVVFVFDPDPETVGNGTVAVGGDHSGRSGLQQDRVHGTGPVHR